MMKTNLLIYIGTVNLLPDKLDDRHKEPHRFPPRTPQPMPAPQPRSRHHSRHRERRRNSEQARAIQGIWPLEDSMPDLAARCPS